MATWQIKGVLLLASALAAIALVATTSGAKPTPWGASVPPRPDVVVMVIEPPRR